MEFSFGVLFFYNFKSVIFSLKVTEDNADDDVQCMTPNVPQKINTSPPQVNRVPNLADVSSDNIIQMTENDVTVNAATGGLKFRVDPQTLSSNKMYRLPDGRIFAINANPNMPGGYSATIVAVTETNSGKIAPKGATYAAKLSAVPTPPTQHKINSPSTPRNNRTRIDQPSKKKVTKKVKPKSNFPRKCDLNVPVEWYRFSLIDATDSLEYSLSKLQKIKKDATTAHLRTRTIDEMRNLHRVLDRLLNTSVVRFNEIRENLSREMKNYIAKKTNRPNISDDDDDDDDDVEILNELENNDDPIFIDENSTESNNATGINEAQEVDLTEVESEHNDSAEKSIKHYHIIEKSSHSKTVQMEPDDDASSTTNDVRDAIIKKLKENGNEKKKNDESNDTSNEKKDNSYENRDTSNESIMGEDNISNNKEFDDSISCNISDVAKVNGDSNDKNDDSENNVKDNANISKEDGEQGEGDDVESLKDKDIQNSSNEGGEEAEKAEESKSSEIKMENMDISEDKTQDAEMSDEMIESLLKGDSRGMDDIETPNIHCLEDFQDC